LLKKQYFHRYQILFLESLFCSLGPNQATGKNLGGEIHQVSRAPLFERK
jgi:hypothetical protein